MRIERRKQQGFTLIELMIVVAIIGILAAIAIPQYQNYVIRSQAAEASTELGSIRPQIAEFYASTGHFPTSNESAGIQAPATSITGKYVTSVDVGSTNKKAVTITFGNAANEVLSGHTIVYSMIATGSSIELQCTDAGDVPTQYLPSDCRNNQQD
ncbi:pilin [Salinisphaera sp. USBA-960]|uniref:pilin n=1 Tax=Salinisphaera orenii TaxID=856731 RepID=UPI0013A65593|nr:pilin [Salifodinibacter halophilus]NNC25830.1 pilin [Salifodinibacter halophilus]